MSQVKVKVTGQNFLYEWEALVTRNLHAKYESISERVQNLWPILKLSNKQTNQQTGQKKQYVPAIATGDIKKGFFKIVPIQWHKKVNWTPTWNVKGKLGTIIWTILVGFMGTKLYNKIQDSMFGASVDEDFLWVFIVLGIAAFFISRPKLQWNSTITTT